MSVLRQAATGGCRQGQAGNVKMSSDKPGLSLYQPHARGQGSGSLPTIVECDSCALDVVTVDDHECGSITMLLSEQRTRISSSADNERGNACGAIVH
ncbi:hypothetical protein C0Q70_01422 [Pomacea canaliculata]|uniref:Uncharacterized protein n=1 Tax=Pomacea canaliculata TaxID=400727 RepID=A0A2T7PZG3_POMCA|nr:hypothetical protein C0Q70_01422 [Pomacea canaliculata]